MARPKTNGYIDLDLEWLEKKAKEIKKYCDQPLHKLTDRIIDGKVISKIEDQMKSIRDALQDYIRIIEAIDRLKEKEGAKKITSRGDQELSPFETGGI